MLLSMTGQGQGRQQCGAAEITAEVRAVNNRHLKIQTRTSDGLGGLEPKIEASIRQGLRRGSLQMTVQVVGGPMTSDCFLQETVVESYVEQCRKVSQRLGLADELSITSLLALPGVIADPKAVASVEIDDELEAAVLRTVEEAINSLNQMRQTEGQSMAMELAKQLARLRELSSLISERAPQVVEEYRERLSGRLGRALEEIGAQLQEADLVREVLVMADKADIREELVRLGSHFDQFEQLLESEQSQGRKLDFLIQELFRETNTIGSKAGDALIAQRVVDMKTVIEQMRELVQNVE